MNTNYKEISIDRILDPEAPMRSDLTKESVEDLVESIKKVGIIEPLIVRKSGENFEVIAGHRRLFACRIANKIMVPCIVRDETGLEAELLKVHENLARAEISPVDWAKHLTTLKTQYKLTTAKIAEVLGMSDAWVDQHLAILNYPEKIYTAVEDGKLSFSAARELSQIKDPIKLEVYARAAIRGGVTPGMAAQWRKEANGQRPTPTTTEENTIPENTENTPQSLDPICPVCSEAVPFTELLTIQIHARCRPE